MDGGYDWSGYFNQLSNQINTVNRNVGIVNDNVNYVSGRVNVIEQGIVDLKKDFIEMMRQQRMQAALQRAITEIIRVRQELEQKYGSYKLVRDNMLGILQAADLSLIRESTIANCTEELMLSAPSYWLAPCLIALAGWISNNKNLAQRALKVALERDDEKTSLLFALVCRRNGKTEACFEWLARYFKMQKANNMKQSIVAYLDAYTNGVFGDDVDGICEGNIKGWMEELKADEAFDSKQNAYWKNFYSAKFLKEDNNPNYVALKSTCAEFAQIDAYAKRVKAVASIKAYFEEILKKQVNVGELIKAIDNQLINLVSKYDDQERPLREEEERYELIKKYNGDEDYVDRLLRAIAIRKQDRAVNFAERLSQTITSEGSENSLVSAKKTSVKLLGDYIESSYTEFITEKKEDYPDEVTLKMKIAGIEDRPAINWSGKTTSGANRPELKKTIETKCEEEKQAALANVSNKNVTTMMVIAIVAAVLGIVFMFFAAALGVIAIVGAIIALVMMFKNKKKNQERKDNIIKHYDTAATNAKLLLDKSIDGKIATDKLIADFEATANCDKLNLKEMY